nr:MAG TPA: hypothetical protein [Caudoviricetes sp.]
MQKSSTLIRSVMTMPSSESYLVWHPMTLWISVSFILTEKPRYSGWSSTLFAGAASTGFLGAKSIDVTPFFSLEAQYTPETQT